MTGQSCQTYLIDRPDFAEGAAALARAHPELRPYAAPEVLREWKCAPGGLAGLSYIVIGQQVSTNVAEVLWRRFTALLENEVTPDRLLGHGMDELRGIGLSRQKAGYITGLARAVNDGVLDVDAIAGMDDAAAMAELLKLKGIGPWSAEIYLMFALGRKNIWPAGDLGIQLGLQLLKGLKEKPSPDETRILAEAWQPQRSVAALMMWRCYLDKKSL